VPIVGNTNSVPCPLALTNSLFLRLRIFLGMLLRSLDCAVQLSSSYWRPGLSVTHMVLFIVLLTLEIAEFGGIFRCQMASFISYFAGHIIILVFLLLFTLSLWQLWCLGSCLSYVTHISLLAHSLMQI
jgi:hypothetical protein